MAPRGRPPKPTLVKEKTGNPGQRKLNTAEPKPNGEATAPKGMSKAARAVWDRIVFFQASGLYTPCDETILAHYCKSEALRAELEAELEKQPLMTPGSTGQMIVNPLLKQINDQIRLLKELGGELGLSPRARQSLQINQGGTVKTNKFANSLGGTSGKNMPLQ